MKEGDDLVLHIQGFEHILQELLDMIPEDQLSNYLYNKPLEQSKCLAKGLPQGFLKQLQVIKIVNTIGNGKSTSLSDSIGIGKFCNMKFPPYEDFKALLLALFESELALDDSNSKSDSTRGGRTPMFFSKTSTSINPTGKVSWGCWDCDGDHSRGSDECPHPGSMAFAPPHVRERVENGIVVVIDLVIGTTTPATPVQEKEVMARCAGTGSRDFVTTLVVANSCTQMARMVKV